MKRLGRLGMGRLSQSRASGRAVGGGGSISPSSESYSAEASAIFAAFTTPPTAARKAQIEACVSYLKNAGVWARLDVLYLLAAANSQAARINWKTPGTFTLTEVNSPTFGVDQGYTGNGTDMQLDTGVNPSTLGGGLTQNDACAFVWGTRVDVSGAPLGTNAGTGIYIYPRYTDGNYYHKLNTATDTTAASSDGSGLVLSVRTASDAGRIDRNGAQLVTLATTSSALVNSTIRLLKAGADFYGGKIICAGVGMSLSAAQSASLYQALVAYFNDVGTTL